MSGNLKSPTTIVGCCGRECKVEKRFVESDSDEEGSQSIRGDLDSFVVLLLNVLVTGQYEPTMKKFDLTRSKLLLHGCLDPFYICCTQKTKFHYSKFYRQASFQLYKQHQKT